MKALLIRLLAALGLVTAGRYQLAADRRREAEVRAKRLAKLLDDSRAEVRAAKAKAHETAQQLKAVARDASLQMARVDKQRLEGEKQIHRHKQEVEKLQAAIDHLRKTSADMEALRKQLAHAETDLAIAREQLMMVEVKLDILEGAANVLDGRTRSVLVQPADDTRQPV